MEWIAENIGSLLVGLGLLAVIALIIFSLVRNRRKGIAVGCGCGCSGCDKASTCSSLTLNEDGSSTSREQTR